MELIIDTNIIVSALLSPDGKAFQFLSEVFDGKYAVFISQEVYKEYEEVLHREKFAFDEDTIIYVLEWFKDNAIWVEVTSSTFPVSDEKDRIFYDIAKSCKIKLITGNTKHYPVDELVTSLGEMIT
ncbi:MAG: putative toxin-antitoxin system toxin component, PIN family [Bacillus sp. (in: Bacteria)]|nr:putative toxin-antitoxin system toxin component, PIN family [Bacillus sp. (in: firmicutes)]MCM1425010.1 putative toxin-antitoxin system toxin component, PIN family [Eubacterium sp.]